MSTCCPPRQRRQRRGRTPRLPAAVGWERRPSDLGITWRLETGWVTGRPVEYYLTDTADVRPADTFLIRAGVWY
ncbi:MAG: hypothetical protein WD060_05205 [Pirellulales bacterium]